MHVTRGLRETTTPRPTTDAVPEPHSTRIAVRLLARLVAQGVTDIVVCPGSRSQALALAAAQLEEQGDLRMHVRIDERSAGFLALGIAAETGRAVPVVVTSGTAAANLHPAVLEAWHSGRRIIAVTADRPPELVGIGANQATVQPGMFLPHVESIELGPDASNTAVDDAALAALALQGPAHLNVALRAPLSSAIDGIDIPQPIPSRRDEATHALKVPFVPHTVVIAGDQAGEGAEALAAENDWPLIAEVSSGARFGRRLVVAYRDLLGDADLVSEIERVIVFGHPTLSREVPALIEREGVETIAVGFTGGEPYNPGRCIRERCDRIEVERPTPDERRAAHAWSGRWIPASRAIEDETRERDAPGHDLARAGATNVHDMKAFTQHEFALSRARVTRGLLARSVWAVTWPHDRLVVAASRLVRELDRTVPGKSIRVIANRGLAGIDGTIATAMGVALCAPPGGTTRLLIGDLAFLHDVGSLAMSAGETAPNLQIIVGNDRGGTIFDGLEVAGSAPAKLFDRVQLTEQRVEIAPLAEAYGCGYELVHTRSELDAALSNTAAGVRIIEVALDR